MSPFDEPKQNWKLEDWLRAVGNPSIPEIVRVDERLQLYFPPDTEHRSWANTTVYTWKKRGIARRQDAIRMIAALSQVAHRDELLIFSYEHFVAHSRLFLKSSACSRRFAELDANDLEKIQALDSGSVHDALNLLPLVQRVHPRPPQRLFGREQDMKNILGHLSDNFVTVVSSIAGNGKTALTWFAAQEAQKKGFCKGFDWTTDKRFVVDEMGARKETHIDPLNYMLVLRSMVSRFGWDDLIGVTDQNLPLLCAEKLRQGSYLIVVDNLETLDDSEKLVTQLLDLFGRGYVRSGRSRALITSRHEVQNQSGCVSIGIGGIDEDARIPYIQFLENNLNVVLSDTQRKALAEITDGNPLFLQIALQRYKITPFAFEQIVNDIQSGSNFSAFGHLFRPLIERLDLQVLWLARCAAQLPIIYLNDLQEYWNFAHDQTKGDVVSQNNNEEVFYEAISILQQKAILDYVPNGNGQMVMHPLIRAYLNNYK